MSSKICLPFEEIILKANEFLDSLKIVKGDPEKSQNDFFQTNRKILRDRIFLKKSNSIQ